MRGGQRKSTPGVVDGRVKKKNRTALSPDPYESDLPSLEIRRMRPAKGYYHAVSVTDVRRMIALIPDWDEVAQGIRAVFLTPGGDDAYGRYNNAGIIKLDAWPRSGIDPVLDRKRWLLAQIGIDLGSLKEGDLVQMNRDQARCFLLLGTFLHEIGHHLDRMSTRSKRDAANGEAVAVAYEHRRQQELYPAYCAEFGVPGT